MTTFKQFLSESYKNLFTPEQKKKYADEAYAQLVKSYKKVGGLHGAGFKDVDDFINNIPFWKLKLGADGRIISGAYYKDKHGRKRVAVSSDGSKEGIKSVIDVMLSDLGQKRSYGEISSASLNFLVKQIGYEDILKFAISPKEMEKISDTEILPVEADDEEVKLHPQLKKYFYRRKIGGVMHAKIAIGTTGNHIT